MKAGDTKSEILDVAQDLVQSIGPNALSYQHISDAVNIKKASIHYHFPTKEDLLAAVMERYSADCLAWIDQLMARKESPDTKMRSYLNFSESIFEGNRKDRACVCGMMSAEFSTLGPKTSEVLRRYYRECDKRLISLLKEGQTQGVFRKDRDCKTLAGIIMAFIQGSTIYSRVEGGRKKFKAFSREMLEMLKP